MKKFYYIGNPIEVLGESNDEVFLMERSTTSRKDRMLFFFFPYDDSFKKGRLYRAILLEALLTADFLNSKECTSRLRASFLASICDERKERFEQPISSHFSSWSKPEFMGVPDEVYKMLASKHGLVRGT